MCAATGRMLSLIEVVVSPGVYGRGWKSRGVGAIQTHLKSSNFFGSIKLANASHLFPDTFSGAQIYGRRPWPGTQLVRALS